MAKQNNEVYSFMCWSILSSLEKSRYVLKKEKRSMGRNILLPLTMREKDIDKDYIKMCYDTNMTILNHCFLKLVKMEF